MPNNSGGGKLFKRNNSTVQKVTSIFVFFSAKANFLLDEKPSRKASLENYADRGVGPYFVFFSVEYA